LEICDFIILQAYGIFFASTQSNGEVNQLKQMVCVMATINCESGLHESPLLGMSSEQAMKKKVAQRSNFASLLILGALKEVLWVF
jgi:hypothetical protein